MDECKHKWERIDDAYGDLEEAHLTTYFVWYRCPICGAEEQTEPEDFEEPFEEPSETDFDNRDIDFVYDPLRRTSAFY